MRAVQQAGIGYVDVDALAAAIADARIGQRTDRHFLRLTGRARVHRADRQDMVRCGDAHPERGVDRVKGCGDAGDIRPVKRKEGDAVDKSVVLLVNVLATADDAPDLLDIGVANQNRMLFVQEVEVALSGVRDADASALLSMHAYD